MSDERKALTDRMQTVENAIFGDRENLNGFPGLIAEVFRQGAAQVETNKILGEVRSDIRRVNWMIIGGFIAALISIVHNGFTATKSVAAQVNPVTVTAPRTP